MNRASLLQSPWCGCEECQPKEENQWLVGSIPQYPPRVSSIEQSASEWLAGLAFEPDAYTRVCHGAPPHRCGSDTGARFARVGRGLLRRATTEYQDVRLEPYLGCIRQPYNEAQN